MLRFSLMLLSFFVLACASLSCGGGQPTTASTGPAATTPKSGLPWPPPAPVDMPRRDTSELIFSFSGTDWSVDDGSDFNYAHATPGGYVLDMPPGDVAWAMYPLDVAPAERPLSLSLIIGDNSDLASPPPLPFYVAVANFNQHRWDLLGPYTTRETLVELSADVSRETYVQDDVLYATVVVYYSGNPPATTDDTIISGVLTMTGDPENVPPVADLSVDPAVVVDTTTVTWDASGSTDTDGSIVDYEWDFDNNGIFNEAGTLEETARGQMEYELELGLIQAGEHSGSVRVTDDAGSSDTATATFRVNAYPSIIFSVTPETQDAHQGVDINVTEISDDDGSVVLLEWDLDGDGVFGEPGDEADNEGQLSFQYVLPEPGSWHIAARVTDNDGGQITNFRTVTSRGWVMTDVLGAIGPGWVDELHLVGLQGNTAPALCFLLNNHVYYYYADDRDGSNWNHVDIADLGTGEVLFGASLELIGGYPAIAYFQRENEDLRYAYAASLDGANPADWTYCDVDTGGDQMGAGCSLAEVDGVPAITYHDYVNGMLCYAYASTATPTMESDWTVRFIDNFHKSGIETSLAQIGGKPFAVYSDRESGSVRYAYSTTVLGGGIGDWVEGAWSGTSENNLRSVAIASGTHPLLFRVETNGNQLYCHTGADITGGWTTTTAIHLGSNHFAGHLDAALVGGRPVTGNLTFEGNELLVYRCDTADGTGTWSQLLNEPITQGDSDNWAAIASVGGQVAVAWYDFAGLVVRYGIYYE